MVKVVCPHCGADQLESNLAVSTFCRNCGEHYKLAPIQQKAKFSLSGLFKSKNTGNDQTFLQPAVKRPESIPEPLRSASSTSGFDPDDEEDGSAPKPKLPPVRTRQTEGFETEAPAEQDFIEVPGMNALTDHGGDGKPFEEKQHSASDRRLRCVDCEEVLYVSAHAKSTICSSCSAYVSLQSHDISRDVRENIKTRGDIRIKKGASLTATQVVCNQLKVYGEIAGKIDCGEDAFFKTSGKVVGSIRCKRLIIHKSCDLKFVPGIHAETAEIYGKVEGDIICDGKIKISKTGSVVGDCTAPTVVLEDGGVLAGQMRFSKPDSEMMAEYNRRALLAQEDLFREDEDFAPTGDTVIEDDADFDFEDEDDMEEESEAA